MTIQAYAPRSSLVYAATDGKHRPASHPAMQRHGFVPPSTRYEPPTKPKMPVIRVSITGLDGAALERRRRADRKRERYHSDPAFAAAMRAATARYKKTDRAKALRKASEQRKRAERLAGQPPKVAMTPAERRAKAAATLRRRYREDAAFRAKRRAQARARYQAMRSDPEWCERQRARHRELYHARRAAMAVAA